MSEQPAGPAHPPAHNQRRGEEPAPGAPEPDEAGDEVSLDTPAIPESGAHRPSAPSGEVAPT